MHTVNFMLNNIEHNINEIKEKEIFLQNLIDALPDAVRIIDEDYNIVLANKAYDGYIKKQYLFKSAKCYGAYNGETQCPCSASLYLCPLKELQKSKSSGMKTIHSVNNRQIRHCRIFPRFKRQHKLLAPAKNILIGLSGNISGS